MGDGRKPLKVGHLFMLQGKNHVEVPQTLPGAIVAVAKVEDAPFDAVLHDAAEDDHLHLRRWTLPSPLTARPSSPNGTATGSGRGTSRPGSWRKTRA